MSLYQWWRQRQPGERLTLSIAAVVLACLVIYLLLEPGIEERARMVEELPQLQADLDWMQSNAGELQRLRDGQGASMNVTGEAMSPALIQSLLQEMGLENAASELGTAINRGVSLDFGVVAYPDLIEFLYQLTNRSDARVSEADIVPHEDQQGMVRARLVFRPAAAL